MVELQKLGIYMKWQYEGIDPQGDVYDGIVEASNFKEVLKICISKGLYPRDIRQLSSETARNYSQIHRLKRLKTKIESGNTDQTDKTQSFSKMVESFTEEEIQSKWDIDWVYVSFIMIIIIVIVAGILI